MFAPLRWCLLAGIFLAAHPVWGDDTLPRLPAGGPESLPSLSTSSISITSLPDQTLSVTCYLGNPNDKQSIGSITVNSPAAAGPTCNSLNYACQGRCFGCYADFDLSDDVCVDSAGRKFIR